MMQMTYAPMQGVQQMGMQPLGMQSAVQFGPGGIPVPPQPPIPPQPPAVYMNQLTVPGMNTGMNMLQPGAVIG